MASNPRRANGTRRNRIRREIAAQGLPCALCGQPIDYDAPYFLDDGKVNPDAFVVDEIIPVARGGNPLDINNCQPAHSRCNLAKGARMPGDDLHISPILRSRDWLK